MATKEEIEDELNDRLNLDMEWSQMKKEDLEKFRDGLDEEEFLLKFVGQYANKFAGELAQEQVENWSPGQFAELLSQTQKGEASPIDMFF